jgi:hypothetical protein
METTHIDGLHITLCMKNRTYGTTGQIINFKQGLKNRSILLQNKKKGIVFFRKPKWML